MRAETNQPSSLQKGVALLAVLWLAVALSLMALATAQMVRTEVQALSNQMEWQRGYYLARGGLEAAIYSIAAYQPNLAAPSPGPETPAQFLPGKRWLQFEFPGGSCTVEIVPENAKLDVNQAAPEQLAALFEAVGLSETDSLDLAAAIADWRAPRASDAASIFDQFYSGLSDPYPARHAPIEQLEELLPVRGMSRDLFFGRLEKSPEGRWQKTPGLADLLTVGPVSGTNPNFAPFEVLRSLPGWNREMANAVLSARAKAPFRSIDDFQMALPGFTDPARIQLLTVDQGPIYTLTATGSVGAFGVRRSVRARVVMDSSVPVAHRVLAWWDEWPWPARSDRL